MALGNGFGLSSGQGLVIKVAEDERDANPCDVSVVRILFFVNKRCIAFREIGREVTSEINQT